jgi:uncharacterized membrane protein YfcA
VAVAIFAAEGLIDWKMSLPLSMAFFVGAVVGALLARKLSNVWLRRIFLTAVIVLAAKTLLIDVGW